MGDLAGFCRQLAILVDAGIPLVRCLDILTDQVANDNLKAIIAELKSDLEAGDSFSAALAKHPKVFSIVFTSLIKAGEEGGSLQKILAQLASYQEAQYRLRKKIKSAMTYPVFIACFFLVALMGIVFFLIPTFENIFSGLGAELPPLTLALMAISHFATANILYEFGGVAVVVISYLKWSHTNKGRYLLDRMKLRLPIFGEIIKKVSVARFSQTLGTLVQSGVSVIDALEIAGNSSGNLVISGVVRGVQRGVIAGSTIAEQMGKSSIFPKMMVGMISAGEESGALAQMLGRVANVYDEEVDSAVSGLTSIIEPILMLGMGVVVLIVVLAIYLPVFKLATAIH